MKIQTQQTEKSKETKKVAGLLFAGSIFIRHASSFIFGNFMMYVWRDGT